ncbi:MAG TPA: GntR family transcriptional regulator [Streptosporangiaceae bacterium]|nr:GntR family transcriptional regulator [Streptosporangiaceae bacterium]
MGNPMYRQIAEDLREQIESGGLEPGQQIRTENELQEKYGASRNTVRDAIKWLTTLGLVETRPGQGTFVVKKIIPFVTTLTADPKIGPGGDEVANYGSEVEAQRRTPSNSDPQVETQKASPVIAGQLRIAAGSFVISRHVKRYIDGTPWSLQTSFYPMGFALKGADELLQPEDIKPGAVRYLSATLGLQQVGYRDWITVRAPDAIEAVFFNLPQDGRIGVFENFRIGFDQTGTPMRVTVTIFPTDRNQFIVNVGEVALEEMSGE